MSDWVERAANLLEVIYWKIKADLFSGGYVQVDETPIRFIDLDIKKGKSSQGYFWLVVHPSFGVFIHWDRSRGQLVAEELLDRI